MKQTITLILLLVISTFSFGQIKSPRAITPEVLLSIQAEVNKEVIKFRQSLIKENSMTKESIEYSIDTFKLQHIALKKVDIDFSTPGINNATYEVTEGYNRLMNKYYKKLLQMLEPNDKKVLLYAQKMWLQFRKSETKLIDVLTEDKYCGGGAMELGIVADDYSDIVIKRTDQLFNYYETTVGLR